MDYKIFNSNYKITQVFANKDVYQMKDYYAKYGLAGHNGLDLVPINKNDLNLYNCHNGIIMFIGWNGAYGNCVKIWCKELDILEYYCHLSFFSKDIKIEKWLTERIYLGQIGNSGGSFGIHLHYGIYKVDEFCNKLNTNINDKTCIKGAVAPLPYLE